MKEIKNHRGSIFAVIVAESILIQIKLKLFRRYRMINTLDTIFNQRPKTPNGVGVAVAQHIDFIRMGNGGMVEAKGRQS